MGIEDDAHGQQVVDFLEGHVLRLHLVPDAVGSLHARFDIIGVSEFVQLLADGLDEGLEGLVEVRANLVQTLADLGMGLGVFVFETQVLQLFLDAVEA